MGGRGKRRNPPNAIHAERNDLSDHVTAAGERGAAWPGPAKAGRHVRTENTLNRQFHEAIARVLLFVAVVVVMWGVPAFGHHSLAEYDDTQVTTVDGTLIDLRFKNPHSLLTIEVSRADGATERWTVEWMAALVLKREGVKETTLKPGDRLLVTGYPSRNRDERRLWLRTITRPIDRWNWSGGF